MQTLATTQTSEQTDLLRFLTAGSVDDGKSTLIGRLLYDSKTIFEDQLTAIENTSKMRGDEHINLALLTDGLRAEREQGITIDVAYRYFSTPKRKFILADTPGHIQYTRNMVTGASSANVALLLIDARQGIVEQTRRHAFITTLLQIKHLIICINKMDLVNFDEQVYEKIKAEFADFSSKLEVNDVRYIPLSALKGDNVVNRSEKMPWYQGPTLLYLLETIHVASDYNLTDCRFPVQYVIRPLNDAHHDYRGYAGRIESGVFKIGDKVMALPSGFESKIKTIEINNQQLDEAFPPLSVTITLNDDIDISRGDMLVKPDNKPNTTQDIDLRICWMNEKKLVIGKKYIVKHTTREVKCVVKDVAYKVNINTLHRIEDDKEVGLNDIARIKLRVTAPLFTDPYIKNRATGSLIIIDEFTNETLAAGMII